MSKPLYIIIDGNSFMHRAYHALPAFTNKKGFPTQIITGTCNMINSAIKKMNPEKIVVAFDHRGKNFRHDIFVEYKANRKSMDDDFRKQIEPLKSIINAWGLPMMSIAGVEADDSMSTLALQAKDEGYSVIMMTSDKDMRQIIQDDIGILDTKDFDKKDSVMYRDEVKEKMGIYPEQVIPYLALVGDRADNVPGVEGIGEKTAQKLLNEYHDKNGLIDNKENLKGKMKERFCLAVADGSFETSIQLVTIKKDVEIGKKPSEFNVSMNEDELISLLNEYEMFNFKKTLNLVDKNAKLATITTHKDTLSISKYFSTLLFKEQKLFIETFTFEEKDYLICSSENTEDAFVFDIESNLEAIKKQIRLFSQNHEARIVSINSKDVLKVLYKHIMDNSVFDLLIDDVRVYDYVLESGRSKVITIENLNNLYCNFNLSELREKYKLNGKTPKWDKMDFDETVEVRSEEIVIAKDLYFKKEKDLDFKNLSMDNKLVPVLAFMEAKGVLIDKDKLISMEKELDEKIKELETNIFDIVGEEFNILSPKQLSEMLFVKLNIESKKKSTAEDVLIALSEENPIVLDVLKYRSLNKLKSTYVNGLINRLDKENRVHTQYNQTLTTTGRLSSENPNLQNIPIKTEEGRKIREAFIAKDGYKILALDYSQIELRILAHFCKDKNFIDSFNSEKDVHTYTASILFDINMDEVTYEQRRIGKTINFGLIYGMSERRLAEELGIDKKEARLYYKNFFNTYSDVKPYFESELELAKENLYIETLFNRKISTKDVNSSNSFARSHAEKSAKNARIQGTASEIIKKAMIEIFNTINKENIDADMLIQVHDELVFEVREDIADEVAVKIKHIMENVVKLDVPLIVEYKIADNYSFD